MPELDEQELLNELEAQQQEDLAQAQEEQMLNQAEFQEAYGAPEPEEKQNQHTFLHRSAFESPDTVRTTYLSESELGRPLFSVRFLLDLEDVSIHYVGQIIKELGKKYPEEFFENKIAIYFHEKIQNISSSGMSYKGFTANLNVTRKMDATRKRIRDQQFPPKKDMKGG